jgi:hypothetical protein
MKRLFLVVVVITASLPTYIRHKNVKVLDVLLKSSIGIRKDIGIAD